MERKKIRSKFPEWVIKSYRERKQREKLRDEISEYRDWEYRKSKILGSGLLNEMSSPVGMKAYLAIDSDDFSKAIVLVIPFSLKDRVKRARKWLGVVNKKYTEEVSKTLYKEQPNWKKVVEFYKNLRPKGDRKLQEIKKLVLKCDKIKRTYKYLRDKHEIPSLEADQIIALIEKIEKKTGIHLKKKTIDDLVSLPKLNNYDINGILKRIACLARGNKKPTQWLKKHIQQFPQYTLPDELGNKIEKQFEKKLSTIRKIVTRRQPFYQGERQN